MGESPYKLQVKIGQSEFLGEGPEDKVTAAYDLFLKALSSSSSQGTANPLLTGTVVPVPLSGNLDAAVFDHAFKRVGDIISLRHQPPTSNKVADAAIVLMYGYWKLAGIEDVPVIKLNEGLRQTGFSLTRLDRELVANETLFRKGGQKSGGRYSLNNQGIQQAERWLKEWT